MNFKYTPTGIIVNGQYTSLQTIINNCLHQKIEQLNLVILQIQWKFDYRSRFDGCLEKIAVPLTNALKLKEMLVGKSIDFGEINGKHSQIYGNIEDDEITILDDKQIVLNFLLSYPNGHDFNHSFIHTYINNLDLDSDEYQTIENLMNYELKSVDDCTNNIVEDESDYVENFDCDFDDVDCYDDIRL